MSPRVRGRQCRTTVRPCPSSPRPVRSFPRRRRASLAPLVERAPAKRGSFRPGASCRSTLLIRPRQPLASSLFSSSASSIFVFNCPPGRPRDLRRRCVARIAGSASRSAVSRRRVGASHRYRQRRAASLAAAPHAFESAADQLKISHRLPLNTEERVCCITPDRMFFGLRRRQKPKMHCLALSSMLLALAIAA